MKAQIVTCRGSTLRLPSLRVGARFIAPTGRGGARRGNDSRFAPPLPVGAINRAPTRYPTLLLVALLLLSMFFAACSPGHSGGNELAFLRDGQLWRIDPDGSNAFEIAAAGTPIIGFAWSPSHEMFFFRTLDATFAKTTAGKQLTGNAVTGLYKDAPSELDTIGINGGSPIPIQFSNVAVAYSNAWWNTNNARLLYREEFSDAVSTPDSVQWWIAQADQPGGIGRQLLPYSISIPSISTSSSLTIGNSAQ